MRDIKFRGKRLDDGEWVVGDLAHCYDSYINDNTNLVDDITRGWAKVDPSTVGQFTGLQDKNGVDIYEGDVLCGNYGDITYQNEVFFADDGYALRHNHNEYGCCALLTEHENLERIGNIHDNSELIKEA